MKADPPVRRDGKCAVDRKERPKKAVAVEDPFCSAECCREFHGVEFRTMKED